MEISSNISLSSLYQELNTKRTELAKLEKEDQTKELEKSSFKEDYIVVNGSNKNYDENDYERVLDKFKSKDSEVKAHEQAHATNSSSNSTVKYNYQMGPDGRLYAVGGEIRLDTSIPKDPTRALSKLDELIRASSAPSELSQADMQISRSASLNKMLILSQSQGGNNELSN